ncbi:hypothetical protein D9613_001439 [Agrocybe pediades]|uniref:F-box domain-containing protein n=1 Tax=Agrocybe pediades TaxID=84607 RepID=A0A8H4VV59_9AGAR|nr:hypothetical protein D9613_001439 [Agrocybe pediades]
MHSKVYGKRFKTIPDNVSGVAVSSHCPRANCSAHQEIANLEREADETSQTLIFCEAWEVVHLARPKRAYVYEQPQEEKKLSLTLRLAGVCRQWRAVALSLPRIWADVHIFMHRQKGEPTLSILRDIIGRSKQANLTIRMHSDPIDELSRIQQLQPALAILRKVSKRWRSLQICLPIHIIKDLFTPDMDLSRISSLYLHSNQDQHSLLFNSDSWHNKSLRPERLSLDSLTFQSIDIAWDRVTHVVAHHFTTDQAMEVIHSAPNLTSFELMQADEESEVTGLYATEIVHENLRHVIYKVLCSELIEAETIFSYCLFPSLTRVEHAVLSRTSDDSFMDHLIRIPHLSRS